ncbi:MAG TPA: nucleotidyltransferase domain-containing protein [Candidatus Dormibacteraeota bacterium]|nr:nucleotidyltransferase domain-containing protein [Candidatus Dormibacteraeota bacterium]
MVDQTKANQPSLATIKQAIQASMAANKVELAFIFGSYARGEAGPKSDVDVAVDMLPDADLLDLVGFQQDLEEKLGLKVDVTTRRSIAPKLQPFIEPDLLPV